MCVCVCVYVGLRAPNTDTASLAGRRKLIGGVEAENASTLWYWCAGVGAGTGAGVGTSAGVDAGTDVAGADPGFLKGGSRLGLQAKKGGQTGVQFWAQC